MVENNAPLTIRSFPLVVPPLQDVADALNTGLREHYQTVTVEVVDCPDFRKLGCAAAGLGGSARLIEVGGEPYAHSMRYRDIRFNMQEVATACGLPDAYILGAGIAHRNPLKGHCGELIPCAYAQGENRSKVARVGPQKEAIVEDYDSYLHGGIANLFLSAGKTGPVMRVTVRRRISEQGSFPLAIRSSLIAGLQPAGAKQFALGGVFELRSGQVRAHIMPDFECIAYKYYNEEKHQVTQDFLQFYEGMGPHLLCFTVLWTGDPTGNSLHLRVSHEHTHFFHRGAKQEGGHYHYDTTPDDVEYIGYFNLAARIYRVNDVYGELEEEKQSA